MQLSFTIALNLAHYENKLYQTSGYCSRNMFHLVSLDKGLRILFPPHFVYDFSRKMFLMLYYINWPNFIVRFSLLLETLGNVYCNCLFPRLLRHKFWNIILLIKTFFYMTKKSRQKFKYLENKKRFQGEIKSIFHHF